MGDTPPIIASRSGKIMFGLRFGAIAYDSYCEDEDATFVQSHDGDMIQV